MNWGDGNSITQLVSRFNKFNSDECLARKLYFHIKRKHCYLRILLSVALLFFLTLTVHFHILYFMEGLSDLFTCENGTAKFIYHSRVSSEALFLYLLMMNPLDLILNPFGGQKGSSLHCIK